MRLAFSDHSDRSQSIIGMREFLLTITASVSRPTDISFIVSASTSAPGWNSVKDNPTKLVRTFSNSQPREVYFSATDTLPLASPLLQSSGNRLITVDLSTDSGTAGVMNPASTYYVHAYADAKHIASSAPITTADYPQLPAQYNNQTPANDDDGNPIEAYSRDQFNWGTQMWDRGERTPATYSVLADEPQRHTVEVRRGEFALLPERFILPVDADDSPQQSPLCINSNRPTTKVPYTLRPIYEHSRDTVGSFSVFQLVSTDRNGAGTMRMFGDGNSLEPAVLFRNASEIPANKRDEVDDLMISPKFLIDKVFTNSDVAQRFAQDGLILIVSRTPSCSNGAFTYGYNNLVFGVVRVITQ